MLRLWRRFKFVFTIRKSVPFFIHFFQSKEVSKGKKWFFVLFLIGYLLFPWDIVPDLFVIFGLVDDLAVFTFILQWMVKAAPESLQKEYRLNDK